MKSATGTDVGTAITNSLSLDPCYIGNSQIVYLKSAGGDRMYLKSSTGADEGVRVNNLGSSRPCYIGNGQIVYVNNFSPNNKLYLKKLFVYK